tara:strand:+ start:251 stop:367 length:117 start_codon:yes stop_codon:yes gene_type:complete
MEIESEADNVNDVKERESQEKKKAEKPIKIMIFNTKEK